MPVIAGLDSAQCFDILSDRPLLENSSLAGYSVTLDPVPESSVKDEAERYEALKTASPGLRGIVSVQIKSESKPPKFSPPKGVRYTKGSYHSGEVKFIPSKSPVIGKSSCSLTREIQGCDNTWQVDCKVLLPG